MLHDLFWPNLAVFALGQAVAWFHLHTGRLARGAWLMVALLVLADLALVARFAYGAEGVAVGAIAAMQAVAVGEAILLALARWRRVRPIQVARRKQEYRMALVAELRGEGAEALALLRRLARRDPWDVEVAFALACAWRRAGDRRRARRWLRRVRRLDRTLRFADVVFVEDLRLRQTPAAAPLVAASRAKAQPVAVG